MDSYYIVLCIILCHSLPLFIYDLFLYPKCFILGYAGRMLLLYCNVTSLFILMDFPIHIYTIGVELSTSFLKRSLVDISKLWCISVPEYCFILANSEDQDEMQHYAAFYMGLHYLKEYRIWVCSTKRVNKHVCESNRVVILHT